MPKSDSSAGDLAKEIYDGLAKEYGQDSVEWTEGQDDMISVTDNDGVPLFVKVELAP